MGGAGVGEDLHEGKPAVHGAALLSSMDPPAQGIQGTYAFAFYWRKVCRCR